MATPYHTFLGPISNKYTAVIVNIGRETRGNNQFVINVVKMYQEWSNKVRFSTNLRRIKSTNQGEIVRTLSDIYWVHRAVEQGTTNHSSADKDVSNIISLCGLILDHITKKTLKNDKGEYKLTDKFVNTLTYLCELSVSWCLDEKYPTFKTTVDDYKNPTVEEVYESTSYWCG